MTVPDISSALTVLFRPGWSDIEVRNKIGRRPDIALSGGALEASQRLGIEQILSSISHCRRHATALALATSSEPE